METTKEIKKVADVEETKEQVAKEEVKTEVAKKYSDTDLNNLVVKERAKILKDLDVDDVKTAKEFIAKVKAQEEANKTDLQKKDDELTAVTGKLATKDQKIFDLEAEGKARDAGIKKDFIAEAIVLAKAKTTEEKDFDTALSEVVAKFDNIKGDGTVNIGAEGNEQGTKVETKKNWF